MANGTPFLVFKMFLSLIDRDTKIVSQTSSIATVIATENWILKATPYFLRIAHQSDTAVIAVKVRSFFFYIPNG